MKKLLIVLTALSLTACSFIMPRPHDPEMFGRLVDVKIAVNKLECGNPIYWQNTEDYIERLKVYADARQDPQAKAIGQLQESIKKAGESKNKVFCESLVRSNKVRIDVIIDAWKGR